MLCVDFFQVVTDVCSSNPHDRRTIQNVVKSLIWTLETSVSGDIMTSFWKSLLLVAFFQGRRSVVLVYYKKVGCVIHGRPNYVLPQRTGNSHLVSSGHEYLKLHPRHHTLILCGSPSHQSEECRISWTLHILCPAAHFVLKLHNIKVYLDFPRSPLLARHIVHFQQSISRIRRETIGLLWILSSLAFWRWW